MHKNLLYIITGVIRRHIPLTVLFKIMTWRGDGNIAESEPSLPFAKWQQRLSTRGLSLTGKHVLEVGSGRYARWALCMLAAGASRVTLIDLYAIPLDEPKHHAMLKADCARLGLDCDEALSHIEVIRGDILLLPCASEQQVDLVTSQSVLEHVRDPLSVLAACWKWLKPGGVTYHLVDMRDHNLSFRYPFEMLTFSDEVWERWFDLRGGFHLNRWRLLNYLQAMQKIGFVRMEYDILWRDDKGLKKIWPRLHSKFRTMDEEMLSILGIYLYGEKAVRSG